jgi:hypothetical protein
MLYLVLMYGIISLACLLAGILCYQLPFLQERETLPAKPFTVYCLTGLMVISAAAHWLALFFPLNLFTSVTVLVILAALTVLLRKRVQPTLLVITKNLRQLSLISVLALAGFGIMVITLNAGLTMMDDTESYHIQSIKWLQHYGSVPGLANLHIRYGLNSSWFVGIGILSPAIKGVNTYQVVNGLLSLWLCFYFIEKLNGAFINKTGAINTYAGLITVFLVLLITWPMIRGNTSTANYDFITACCILILFIEAIYTPTPLRAEWIVWPCYLFTVRIVHYPLLLLFVPVLWQAIKEKKWRTATAYCITALLFIVPFLIRNVILSGYLFFPSMLPNLFHVDWKANSAIIHDFVVFTRTFNKIYPTLIPIKQAVSIPFPNWIPLWYKCQYGYNKPVLLLSFACYAACIFRYKTLRRRLGFYGTIITLVMVVQLVSWFFVSPDPRFAYGPLLAGVILFFVAMPPVPGTHLLQPARKVILPVISLACLLYAVQKIAVSKEYRNFTTPYSLPQPPVKTTSIGNIQLNVPEKIANNWNARCFDTELPCLYRVNPALRTRGNNLKDGFRLDPNAIEPFSTIDEWE